MTHTSSNVTQLDLKALRSGMSETFSPDEIKTTCFDLSINYYNLPGDTLDAKIIELIDYTKRHGMLQDLITYIQVARPNLNLQQKLQDTSVPVLSEQRKKHRAALREDRRDIYMVHTLRPSSYDKDWYDILVYLVAHQKANMAGVSFAEFFLGYMWGDHIFKVNNEDGFVGIGISAYGPVLCTARVVFTDKHEVLLERYIDFQMAELAIK